jgi:hypothetical protein
MIINYLTIHTKLYPFKLSIITELQNIVTQFTGFAHFFSHSGHTHGMNNGMMLHENHE